MHRHNIYRGFPFITLLAVSVGLLFSSGPSARAQNDFDLEQLLGELEDEWGQAPAAPAAADDDLDALLGELLDERPSPTPAPAAPVDDDLDDLLDDLLDDPFAPVATIPEVGQPVEMPVEAASDPFADLFDDVDVIDVPATVDAADDLLDDFPDIAEVGIEDVLPFPSEVAPIEAMEVGLDDLLDEIIPEEEDVVVVPDDDLLDDLPGDLPMKGVEEVPVVAPVDFDLEMEEPVEIVETPVEEAPPMLDDLDDLDIADFFDDLDEPAPPVADVMPDEALDPFADLGLDDLFAEPTPPAVDPEPVVDEPAIAVVEPAPAVAVDPAPVAAVEPTPAERADELSAAEIIRRRAAELEGQRLIDRGIGLLGEERYEAAFRDLDAGLAMIHRRPATEDLVARAQWGKSEAQYRIALNQANEGDFDAAAETLRMALQGTPNHRGALRLQSRLPRLEERSVFRADTLPEVVETDDSIRRLLHEGREYYRIGRYDEAERKFQQVRLLDPYNKDTLRFLRRVDEARYRVSTFEREKTVADLMNQVRQRWSPPIEKDIEMVDRPDGLPRPEVTAADEVIQRMRNIIIPSLEFRNANIIDVVERLRLESERADPEGLGVNIVLKLDTGPRQAFPAAAPGAPAAPAPDPFAADDPFAPGGFDDFGPAPFDDFGGADAGMGMAASSVPSLTLTLRRISLFDALQIITEYADLKFRIENRIVFITPGVDISRLETRIYAVQPSLVEVIVERQTDDTRSTGEFIELGSRTEMRRGDVRQFFEDAGVPFPPGTSIVYTPATSQLLVRNTEENLEVFERLLPHFNRPPPQVEIEARFVEVEQTDLEQLGVEWILTDNYEFAFRNDGSPASATQRLQIDANEDGFTKGLRFLADDAAGIQGISRSAATVGGGSFLGNVLSFSSVLTNPELNVVLHALQQKGSADLLSAPRVTTRSGGIATIQVVTEIIYPTEFTSESSNVTVGGGGQADGAVLVQPTVIFPETFETREIGVILNVTPTVGADGFTIDLTLAPEVGELLGWIQYGTPPFNIPQPVFASRSVTTSIVIWDGQTVVLGGLIREELLNFDDKIPILGDIPLIGRLFRSKGERSVKRNLMIFVTARIVDPAGRPVNTGSSFLSSSVSQPMSVDAAVTQ